MEQEIIEGNNNYFNVHQWIVRNYGKANKCECLTCTQKSKNFEWALIKGFNHKRDISHYRQLCISCHRLYDMTEIKIRQMSLSKLMGTNNNKPLIRSDAYGNKQEFSGVMDAQRKTGAAPQTIYDSINNKIKKHRWKSRPQYKWMWK